MTESDSRREAMERLLDRNEIEERLRCYCRGLDRGDQELARSAYHADALDDHQAYIGPADGLVAWADELHRAVLDGHQHYITNISIDFDGDTAHVETYYLLVGRLRGSFETYLDGGRYLDRFERRDGRWAIAARICTSEWVLDAETAARSLPLSVPATRDRDDPSWRRPLEVTREPRVLYGRGSTTPPPFDALGSAPRRTDRAARPDETV